MELKRNKSGGHPLDYEEYIKTVPLKERNNIAEVITEISLHRVLKTPSEHKKVQKVIDELIGIFQDRYQFQHHESIAMFKLLQDMLLADCYEQIINALEYSHDEETFVSHFLTCKREEV
jgi:hypothetical protein